MLTLLAIDMDNANGTSNKNTIGVGSSFIETKPAVFLELNAEIYTEESIGKLTRLFSSRALALLY